MSIIVSGDTHGMFDTEKLEIFFNEHAGEFTKDDFLIICGDTCICGFSEKGEEITRKFFRELPVTTLFVDGNHENFDKLNSYDIDIWNGGKVHFVEESIIHLMRGQVFLIEGKTFFTFGGGDSIDKIYRTEGVSWFPQEMPSKQEYEEGWENLEELGFKVDYILSHTGPLEIIEEMGYGQKSFDEIELNQYLQKIAENTEFKAWYFGHFHEDLEVDGVFFCLYDDLVIV